MKLKVKDHNNLVRDSENMAILNTNKEAINYHNRKMMELKEKEEQREQINTLKQEVSDIKQLLQQIIERL